MLVILNFMILLRLFKLGKFISYKSMTLLFVLLYVMMPLVW